MLNHFQVSGNEPSPGDDANAEGKTEAEAKASIKEAIELMVEDLKKDKDYSMKFVRKYSG